MEPQGRVLDGNLETLGLQATLKMLALGGKTGILSVASGPERLDIVLDNGNILDLDEPGTPPPDLPELFRLLGGIPTPQATELKRLAGSNPSIALDIMQQWGLLSPADAQKWREFRIIQSLSRAIRWERGRFEFQAIQRMHRDDRQPLNVDHALLEALRIGDEWGKTHMPSLTRNTMARWMPEFTGDVAQLQLSREEIGVLCLSNGQFPLHHIAYALLVAEPTVAELMQRLLELGLIEVVDARLQIDLERSLIDLLTRSQHLLSQDARATPDQHMLTLVRTMGVCVNGLLAHHAIFARSLRGRGEVPQQEIVRYLEEQFGPILSHLQRDYPRMDEVVHFHSGQLNYEDVLSLDKVVRGGELGECYWDAIGLLRGLTQMVFEKVLTEEVGGSNIGRQFEDLWGDFLREIDQEMTRLTHQRARAHVQHDRAVGARQGVAANSGAGYAHDMASDPRRRFS
ncbi:MAG: DUF4388 domain-containing protein [Ktedonobacterales bacterium]